MENFFSKLRKQLATYLDKKQITRIEQAYLFAADAHQQQTRTSGEPYITHPLSVANILADMHMDPETIMAALLHDVMEDTNVDKAAMAAKFGNPVATLVDGVSKLTKIKFENKAEAQAENFRKMMLAMAKDIRVILVKLADRLHNLRTLGALRAEKRRRIAQETLEIYVPLANRLGMHTLRLELENLCFQAMHPNRYRVLQDSIKRIQGNRKSVVSVIENAIRNTLSEHKFKYLAVTGREKHLYGIYRKMEIKRLPLSEIIDVYAFRIIVETVEDCYRALGFVHNLYKPVPERFKDYIAIPKANGYQSLHTILFGPYGMPIEIQIRTRDMHATAERGVAAHWIYKEGKVVDYSTNERTQAWLDSILELQQRAGSSLEFVENVKFDLFPDEVYVFTPRGEIMELPRGATIIDFAYEVHSDIGNHCVAGKIDRHYAPLSTKLSNGQTIEIITASNATPKEAWLNFVVTGKARSNIRHFTKKQLRKGSAELGKNLLENALQTLGTTINQLTENQIDQVLKESKYQDTEELYQAIGSGNAIPILIARRLIKYPDKLTLPSPKPQPLSIKGTEGMMVNFATCCRPIPGDAIVGYLETDRGMTVHIESCPIISDVINVADKCVPLGWDPAIKTEFPAEIRIMMHNRRGALADITANLATAEIDIEDVKVLESTPEYIRDRFIIKVKNRQHLATIIRQLRSIKDVIKITRYQAKRKKYGR